MKAPGAPAGWRLKMMRWAATFKKQPVGENGSVSLPPYVKPTAAAALSHAASVSIFEEAGGQELVSDAPKA